MATSFYSPPRLRALQSFGKVNALARRDAQVLVRQLAPTPLPDLPPLNRFGVAPSGKIASRGYPGVSTPKLAAVVEQSANLASASVLTAAGDGEGTVEVGVQAAGPAVRDQAPEQPPGSPFGFAAIELDVTDVDDERFDLRLFAFNADPEDGGKHEEFASRVWATLPESSGRELRVVVTDAGAEGLQQLVAPPPEGSDVAVRLGSRTRRVAVVLDRHGAERIAIRTLVKVTASYCCAAASEADAKSALQIVRRVLTAT